MAIEITRQELASTSVDGLFACASACLFEIMLREEGFNELVKKHLSNVDNNASESEMQEMIA